MTIDTPIHRSNLRSMQALAKAASAARPPTQDCDDAFLLEGAGAKATARPGLWAVLTRPARNIRQATARTATALAPALPYLVAAGTVACLVGVAGGYPCTGYDSAATQNFSNANNTVFGLIHGWFSDCYDYSYACGLSCSLSCTTTYCTATASDQPPSHYVSSVADAVKNCGFELVNSIPAGATTRIASGLIEKNRWVKIVVNTLNLTTVTDPSVICLHAIQ